MKKAEKMYTKSSSTNVVKEFQLETNSKKSKKRKSKEGTETEDNKEDTEASGRNAPIQKISVWHLKRNFILIKHTDFVGWTHSLNTDEEEDKSDDEEKEEEGGSKKLAGNTITECETVPFSTFRYTNFPTLSTECSNTILTTWRIMVSMFHALRVR